MVVLLLSLLSLVTPKLFCITDLILLRYCYNTATEEAFMYAEHHGEKIIKNGIVLGFANQVTYVELLAS